MPARARTLLAKGTHGTQLVPEGNELSGAVKCCLCTEQARESKRV